jgi:uncharacterized cupredoxin-like copper-binding protein
MRTNKILLATVAAGLALLAAACGGGDDESASAGGGDTARRVEIAMVDIDFKPKSLEVSAGEEVEFVFTNDGKVRHEAYIGTPDDQVDHEKEMAEGGKDAGGHDAHGGSSGDNTKITLEPGKTGALTYRFDEAGTYEIGCHEPGHYAAGMKMTLTVS